MKSPHRCLHELGIPPHLIEKKTPQGFNYLTLALFLSDIPEGTRKKTYTTLEFEPRSVMKSAKIGQKGFLDLNQ